MILTKLHNLQDYRRPIFIVCCLALFLLAGCATSSRIEPPQLPAQPPTEPQVEVFRLPGHTVLYDVNSMAVVEIDEDNADVLCDSKGTFQGQLKWPHKPQFSFFGGGTPECRSLVLEATHACNLACSYCVVRNYYEEQSDMMSLETAKRAIDMIPPGRPLSVGFFGGSRAKTTICSNCLIFLEF